MKCFTIGPWVEIKGVPTAAIRIIEITAIDFFKPCKPPQVKGGKTKVKHELHARSNDAK